MSTTLDNYKLSMELVGHSMDVRAVCAGPLMENGKQMLISGSRDKSTKIWRPEDSIYVNCLTWQHHKNFISCVYYNDNEKWICSGSNDNDIYLYSENDSMPFLKLKGHESTVCCLAGGIQPRSIISGSWDATAKIWHIELTGNYTSITLKGHEAAVWAVAAVPDSKKIVTGSADKNIIFWNGNGDKLRMLKGHTDCVRGILALNNGCLVSCANDATIRYWNEDGECIREMTGHTNYIYAIAQHKALGDNCIVSCGEDSSVRMWNLTTGEEIGSPLIHPTQSIWSVACLQNGDIVTGSSDGIVRIFTKDTTRFANTNTLLAYENAAQIRKSQMQEEFGGIKKTDLPGPEALLSQGKREGQSLMVRHPDGSVKYYNWSMGNWNLIGDITGASGGTHTSSGKTLFEGKEYDYVFSVDISDTEPPIKLPYNRGEDPWHSAQLFIHRHNLSQAYLDTVANFIIQNSKPQTLQTAVGTCSTYEDPFTGGNRYVPRGTVNNVQPIENPTRFLDKVKHFPVDQYITFGAYDASKILMKLKEFNEKLPPNIKKINELVLEDVIKLAEAPTRLEDINILHTMLEWPSEFLFPVIDICRLAVRSARVCDYFKANKFLEKLVTLLTTSAANQLMTIRCFVNIMVHDSGRESIDQNLPCIIEKLKYIKSGNGNLQIALATFYLNISITQILGSTNLQKCCIITQGLIEFLKWNITDMEASYRSMQALGNLTTTPYGLEICAIIKSVDCVVERFKQWANAPQSGDLLKVNAISKDLLAAIL